MSSTPTSKEIREWARANGVTVGQRGPIHPDTLSAYNRAHPTNTQDDSRE